MRSTPQNKKRFIDAENQLKKTKDKVQEDWNDTLINEFNHARNSKQFWESFKKLSRQTEEKSVLPLIVNDNDPVFDDKGKSDILKSVFFEGSHLKTTV